MSLDLSSVRAKLTRSQEHAQTIKNEVRAWAGRDPYSLIKKRNADCTRHSLILRVNEPPPTQRWSLIIADAFNNLRNALDHLVYAIAIYEAAPNPPSDEDRLMFPITDSSASFASAISQKRLGTISDPVRTAIEKAQPYNSPHATLPPLLSVLRDLTNSDKHKLLRLAFSTAAQGNIGFAGALPRDAQCKAFPFLDEIKDDTEIFAIVCDRPTPDMDFDRHVIDVVMAIRHAKRDPAGPKWSDRTELSALYTEISSAVRRVIYEVTGKII